MSEQPKGSNQYRCSQCHQNFNSSDELRRHSEQAHSQSKPHTQGEYPSEGQPKGGQPGANR